MSTNRLILPASLATGFLKHKGMHIKRLLQTLREVLMMPNTQLNTVLRHTITDMLQFCSKTWLPTCYQQ